MKNIFLKTFLFLIIAGVLIAGKSAAAQEETINLPKLQLEDFNVSFSPEHPGANTRVSASITSYSFDLNRATVGWLIDNKIAGSGKTFSFITGGLGSSLALTVAILTPNNASLRKTFYFKAVETDLLWETSSYTPPPYRGKALAPAQSLIKVAVIPRGFGLSDSNLIYEWRRNGKNLPDSSGKNRKVLNFYAAERGEEFIELKVSNPDKSAVAENNLRIKINSPKILFYEENPLEGPLYQQTLSNDFALKKPELILRAEPYFFSKRALPIVSYEWTMNDKKIEPPKKPNVLNLAVPSGQKGISFIKLNMENLKNILERAEKSLQINFDSK